MKDFWMYLLPSGFIASLLSWLINRRRERLKDLKDEHTVYRELYEDLKVLIRNQSIEHGKLRRKICRLERITERISDCRYRNQCPLVHQLSLHQKGVGEDGESRNSEAAARGDPAA